MVTVVCDVETDALIDPKHIWVIVCKDVDTGDVHVFREGDLGFASYAATVTRWVGHNFLGFDLGVLSSLTGIHISPLSVTDTLVISKLLWYSIPKGHSLEAWGERLGYPKDTFSDFSQWSQELEDRCLRDVEITYRLYQYLEGKISSPSWRESLEIEHLMAIILEGVKNSGFRFDLQSAKDIYTTLRHQLDTLDREIKDAFPPRSKLRREITPKETKHGTLNLKDFRWLGKEPVLDSFNADAPFSTFDWVEFNPGSPAQIVERLNETGWRPTVKTKSGESFSVCEENLATLPEGAPRATQKLVERFLINKRVTTLEEWFAAVRGPEGQERIHGTINHIGTWTHRCSHVRPNMGNVPSLASRYSGQSLKELAHELGISLRSLWIADEENVLVGCDAEGIQLRIFAHHINEPEFTAALVSGRTEDGTDAHSLNARALGGVTRHQAKTFIYAFLLGAGVAKTARILDCSVGEAKERRDGFIARYPGLLRLREERIPSDVARGYFEGLDGRKVIIDQDKQEGNVLGKVLGGYLQNGEACVMKHANLTWRRELVSNGIPFRQVNFIHDEWQTETRPEHADHVGRTQAQSITDVGARFGLRCPMAGSYRVGKNWYETH